MGDSFLINGRAPSDFGVSVASMSLSHLAVSSLNLNCVAESYEEQTLLNYGDIVELSYGGVRVFYGKITSLPRQAGGNDHNLSYEVSDAWWWLENLVFCTEIERGKDQKEKLSTGTLRESSGLRIREVLQYAIDAGAPFAIGDIDEGIPLWETGIEDSTCADVIRDLMRMSPRLALTIDYASQPVPTFSLKKPIDLREVVVDSLERKTKHSATPLYERQVPAVVITYSKPITIDGATHYQTTVDAAPEGATAATFGAMVSHIELQGSNASYQRAQVLTEERPDAGATGDSPVRWWIKRLPELSNLAKVVGEQNLIQAITIPSQALAKLPDKDGKGGIYAQTYELGNPVEALPPINPKSTPVPPANNAGELPRELVGGSIPDWLRAKQGQVLAKASLLIPAQFIDNAHTSLKGPLKEVFQEEVYLNGHKAYSMLATGSFVGTNAHGGHHLSLSNYEAGESIPQGLAAALYEQTNPLRIEGSLSLVGEAGVPSIDLGCALRFGDRLPWQGALEPIQSLQFDIGEGTLSLEYGPPNQLGVQDLLSLQRAKKRNERRLYMVGSETAARDRAVGGTQSTPNSQFTTKSTPKLDPAPSWWSPVLNEAEDYLTIKKGIVFSHLGSSEEVALSNAGASFPLTGFYYLTYDTPIDGEKLLRIEHSTQAKDNFEFNQDDKGTEHVTTSRTLLFSRLGDDEPVLNQIRSTHLALGLRAFPFLNNVGIVFESI